MNNKFSRLRTISILGSTLAAILLVFFLHYSKVRIPLLGGVKIFSGLVEDPSEIWVVGMGDWLSAE